MSYASAMAFGAKEEEYKSIGGAEGYKEETMAECEGSWVFFEGRTKKDEKPERETRRGKT